MASLSACAVSDHEDALDDEAEDGRADELETAIPKCVSLTPRCPADAPMLGADDGFAVEAVPITWQQCNGRGVAYAPFVYRMLPADITSLTISVDAGRHPTGVAKVRIGSTTFVSPAKWETPPLWNHPFVFSGGTVALPMDPHSAPGPGCLAILPIADGAKAGQTGRVHIATRQGGVAATNAVDLDLVVVNGARISREQLHQMTAVTREVYQGAGLDVGAVTITSTDVVGPVIKMKGRDMLTLRMSHAGTSPRSVPVFFVSSFSDRPEILGNAGGLPGASVQGVASSGVAIAVEAARKGNGDLDLLGLGETLAHEIGHQVGLFHIIDPDGTTDALSDTEACTMSADTDGDEYLTADECLDYGGRNLMFHSEGTNIRQRTLTPQQADVLRSSPLFYPVGGS